MESQLLQQHRQDKELEAGSEVAIDEYKQPNNPLLVGGRFVTFNVLVPAYCDAASYAENDPADLDNERRFSEILKMIHKEIHLFSVIALQELSLDWSNRLTDVFVAWGYAFETSHYGDKKNDFIGVGIAYPETYVLKRRLVDVPTLRFHEYPNTDPVVDADPGEAARQEAMEAIDCQLKLIEQAAKHGVYTEALFGSMSQLIETATSNLTKSKRKAANIAKPSKASQHDLRRKKNHALFLKLALRADEKKTFCVGTYHSPCIYYDTEAMMLFTDCLKRSMLAFAQQKRFVLMGDFNIQPTSDAYQVLAKAKSPKIDQAWQDRFQAQPGPSTPALHDAVLLANRMHAYPENAFTVNSNSRNNPFRGVLDYILVSDGIFCKASSPIQTGDADLMPNKKDPSDHKLIWAHLLF